MRLGRLRRVSWPGLLALALGSVLVTQAFGAALSAYLRWPHAATLARLGSVETANPGDLQYAMDDYRLALGHHDRATDHAVLGQTQCSAALIAPSLAGRDALREQCITSLTTALAREPANPFAAFALALAWAEQEGYAANFTGALRHSLRSGARVPELLVPRARIGLIAWPSLDTDLRLRIADQVRWAIAFDPEGVASVARGPARRALVLRLIADDDQLLKRWEWGLRRVGFG